MGRDAHATAAIVWTYFTELVEVSVAQGEVVPQGQVRSVQHLEGGVVLEIFVLEGDLVEAGQPLVQVELSASELNPDEVQATLDAFILARARLIAESRDEAPVWPQDVVVRQPGIAQAEVLTYESRRAEIETSISVLRQQSEQRSDNSSSAVRSRTQGSSHDSVFPTAGHRRRSVLIRSRQCGGPPTSPLGFPRDRRHCFRFLDSPPFHSRRFSLFLGGRRRWLRRACPCCSRRKVIPTRWNRGPAEHHDRSDR